MKTAEEWLNYFATTESTYRQKGELLMDWEARRMREIQLDAQADLKRENDELKTELERLELATREHADEYNRRGEQLTAANAQIAGLREALKQLFNDCCASDFNEHWDSYKSADQALSQPNAAADDKKAAE